MIASTKEIDLNQDRYDDGAELERFERFNYRRGGEFPVRSHSAQTAASFAAVVRRLGGASRARSTA